MAPLFFWLFSYLLGSIPFGLVIIRLAGLGDIRQIGSGNIGATNVLRTGRKDLALLTLLLDVGKGAFAAYLAYFLGGFIELLPFGMSLALFASMAGACAFLGHCYPLYLGFKGGKGVATFFGTLFALVPFVALGALAVWLLSVAVFRISSLGALVAAIAAPILVFYSAPFDFLPAVLFMSLLIYVRHIPNIKRIAEGKEPRLGRKEP